MKTIRKYFRNVAVALDQLVNALLGGDEDETLCSRWGRGRRKGLRLHTLCANITDWIFLKLFDEPDHCERVIEHIEKNDAIID